MIDTSEPGATLGISVTIIKEVKRTIFWPHKHLLRFLPGEIAGTGMFALHGGIKNRRAIEMPLLLIGSRIKKATVQAISLGQFRPGVSK